MVYFFHAVKNEFNCDIASCFFIGVFYLKKYKIK